MGSSESTLADPTKLVDEITTVSQLSDNVDPILERLKSLKLTTPILKSLPLAESSLTDILVRKPSSSCLPGTLSPNILLELFSIYHDWQEEKAKSIIKKQEQIENKIEIVDALAAKLRQRFNYSVSAMRTTAHHLSSVQQLQLEVGELKGRLTEVISNCDALCKRISTEGPLELQSSVTPFAPINVVSTEGAQNASKDQLA